MCESNFVRLIALQKKTKSPKSHPISKGHRRFDLARLCFSSSGMFTANPEICIKYSKPSGIFFPLGLLYFLYSFLCFCKLKYAGR